MLSLFILLVVEFVKIVQGDRPPVDRQLTDSHVRFQVLTAASMMFRVVFWDILPCKMIVDPRSSCFVCPSQDNSAPPLDPSSAPDHIDTIPGFHRGPSKG
jgi:hypothetical protein